MHSLIRRLRFMETLLSWKTMKQTNKDLNKQIDKQTNKQKPESNQTEKQKATSYNRSWELERCVETRREGTRQYTIISPKTMTVAPT